MMRPVVIMFGLSSAISCYRLFQKRFKHLPRSTWNLCIPRNRRLPVQPGMSPTVHSKEPQVPRSTWNVIDCAFQGTAGVFDLSDIDNKEEPI